MEPYAVSAWNQSSRSAKKARGQRRSAGGFSLVELMVALVIGMLGILVMTQVFTLFEGQKRTTTSGDDAITSGAVALHGVQRLIQQSGWGTSALPVIGCTLSGLAAAALPLVPVTINSPLITGQDADTDTLLIVSGNGNGTVEGDVFTAGIAAGATSYPVYTPTAFSLGDRVVIVPQLRPTSCALNVTTVTGQQPTLGSMVTAGAAPFAVTPGDFLFNLGNRPVARAYAIRNGNLTMCDYTVADCGSAGSNSDSTVWVAIASNIVSLRAEYGRDTSDTGSPGNPRRMDGGVDAWTQTLLPATVSSDPTRNTDACKLLRVGAVRLALVARSSQPERTHDWPALAQHVTPAALGWMGAPPIVLPNPDPAWPTWQDFRYKTFQTVVPLRNITSQGAVDPC